MINAPNAEAAAVRKSSSKPASVRTTSPSSPPKAMGAGPRRRRVPGPRAPRRGHDVGTVGEDPRGSWRRGRGRTPPRSPTPTPSARREASGFHLPRGASGPTSGWAEVRSPLHIRVAGTGARQCSRHVRFGSGGRDGIDRDDGTAPHLSESQRSAVGEANRKASVGAYGFCAWLGAPTSPMSVSSAPGVRLSG